MLSKSAGPLVGQQEHDKLVLKPSPVASVTWNWRLLGLVVVIAGAATGIGFAIHHSHSSTTAINVNITEYKSDNCTQVAIYDDDGPTFFEEVIEMDACILASGEKAPASLKYSGDWNGLTVQHFIDMMCIYPAGASEPVSSCAPLASFNIFVHVQPTHDEPVPPSNFICNPHRPTTRTMACNMISNPFPLVPPAIAQVYDDYGVIALPAFVESYGLKLYMPQSGYGYLNYINEVTPCGPQCPCPNNYVPSPTQFPYALGSNCTCQSDAINSLIGPFLTVQVALENGSETCIMCDNYPGTGGCLAFFFPTGWTRVKCPSNTTTWCGESKSPAAPCKCDSTPATPASVAEGALYLVNSNQSSANCSSAGDFYGFNDRLMTRNGICYALKQGSVKFTGNCTSPASQFFADNKCTNPYPNAVAYFNLTADCISIECVNHSLY